MKQYIFADRGERRFTNDSNVWTQSRNREAWFPNIGRLVQAFVSQFPSFADWDGLKLLTREVKTELPEREIVPPGQEFVIAVRGNEFVARQGQQLSVVSDIEQAARFRDSEAVVDAVLGDLAFFSALSGPVRQRRVRNKPALEEGPVMEE